jgi:Asp-tRNA(Asn)/Glu-tRNA(Gln) amidotransferase A subunit family amidase
MGIQVVGRHFDEATVLALGAAIEGDPACAVPPPPGFAE